MFVFNNRKIWFTADQHFWHKNIIKYCNRPFDDEKEMNKIIIKNYREVVEDDDLVFFLGDLMLGGKRHKNSLEKFIDKLPGEKHLIVGNHDRLTIRDYIDIGFITVHSAVSFSYMDEAERYRSYTLVHDPACAQPQPGKSKRMDRFITGHVHNLWSTTVSENVICVNVGVDVHNFYPVNFRTLQSLFYKGLKK